MPSPFFRWFEACCRSSSGASPFLAALVVGDVGRRDELQPQCACRDGE